MPSRGARHGYGLPKHDPQDDIHADCDTCGTHYIMSKRILKLAGESLLQCTHKPRRFGKTCTGTLVVRT